MGEKRTCKDCSKLSDLLYAANEREGKRIVENARLQQELERVRSLLLQAEAKAQVQS